MLRVQLNKESRYDIEVQSGLCPLSINLSDRMMAEIFYFLQFGFEWKMRKYKRPNRDIPTSV